MVDVGPPFSILVLKEKADFFQRDIFFCMDVVEIHYPKTFPRPLRSFNVKESHACTVVSKFFHSRKTSCYFFIRIDLQFFNNENFN